MRVLICRRIADRREIGARPRQTSAASGALPGISVSAIQVHTRLLLRSWPFAVRSAGIQKALVHLRLWTRASGPTRGATTVHLWFTPETLISSTCEGETVARYRAHPVANYYATAAIGDQAERCYRLAMGGDARSVCVTLCTLNSPSTCPLSLLAYSLDRGCVALRVERSAAMPQRDSRLCDQSSIPLRCSSRTITLACTSTYPM